MGTIWKINIQREIKSLPAINSHLKVSCYVHDAATLWMKTLCDAHSAAAASMRGTDGMMSTKRRPTLTGSAFVPISPFLPMELVKWVKMVTI